MNSNRVIIGGTLTRDPELRHLPTGGAVCNFGVAINDRYKGKDGEWKETATFVDCEAWGKSGEAIAQYLAKGRKILIEGQLKLEQWEKDGERRSKMKVRVESFHFVDSKPGGDAKPPAPTAKQVGTARPAKTEPVIEEADIPF